MTKWLLRPMEGWSRPYAVLPSNSTGAEPDPERVNNRSTSSSTFPSLSPPPSATGDAESSSDDLAAILNFRSDMLSIRERVPMNVERRKLQRATRAVIKVTRQMGNWDSRIPIPYTEGDVAHSWMLWLPFDV
ncbi:unnamed protein product [Diplocarpon coronariae]|nr:hypothetical protein JHW43_002567 [Diplocarpon mali]